MSENETVAQMLRRLGHDKNNCILCEELMGYGYCKDSPDCGAYLCKMADMVETEQRAIIDAQGGSAHNIVKRWAKRHGFPEVAKGESLTEWMRRCFLPVPRYQDGATVEPGSVSYWGTVRFAEVEASDGGWGNWHLHIDETSEVIDGTLNERVPRGLLVEGLPVYEGDVLWFGAEKVTVKDVDGLSDTIFTDYLTEDGEGGWIPYPFESADLSWKRPEGPDSMERIRADALKMIAEYWGCSVIGCISCPSKVDGKTPKERYAVRDCFKAMQLDIIRRTEEVCGR